MTSQHANLPNLCRFPVDPGRPATDVPFRELTYLLRIQWSSWEGAEVAEPPHTRTAATRPALGFADQGPATRVQRGPWADPASRLCSTSQENPTSATAYFPGHHLRHAATDIPNREPAVASAFWLTRKLPSAASAAALTGCLPR